jgi:hypothetical protein
MQPSPLLKGYFKVPAGRVTELAELMLQPLLP